jgi:hypothetical protein
MMPPTQWVEDEEEEEEVAAVTGLQVGKAPHR